MPCLATQNVHNGVLLSTMLLDFQLDTQLGSYIIVRVGTYEVNPRVHDVFYHLYFSIIPTRFFKSVYKMCE